MAYTYFYIYLILICVSLFICNYFKPLNIRHIIIGITTIAYSIIFETLFSNRLGLYYYLDIINSTFYIVLSGIFIYPPLNMIYALFLPENRKDIFAYTGIWIAAMLIFEYISIKQGIVVLTGWKSIPWSPLTYIVTYLWIYYFYSYLDKRIPYFK